MVSTKIVPVLGLDLTVYGLEEYNLLSEIDTPVSIIFALHGKNESKSDMHSLSEALCQLNKKRKLNERYLLVVAFDSTNHGSRYVHEIANREWTSKECKNPYFLMDSWNITNSNATTVSQLIDVLEEYLFPPRRTSIVQLWGVVGYSMGGHSSFFIAVDDPRVEVVVSICGMSDPYTFARYYLKAYKVPKENYPTHRFLDMLRKKKDKILSNINSTHILILNGENDQTVPKILNEPLIQSLRKVHTGIEGYDWKACILPNLGHEWPNTTMIEHSVDWVYQWAMKTPSESKL